MICSISDSFSSCSLAQNQLNLRRSRQLRQCWTPLNSLLAERSKWAVCQRETINFNRWVFNEDQPSAINRRNLQLEQKPCYLGGPGSDGEKGVLSHTLQQNYYTGWVRGWGNKDDVGDVWANLFPTPLFFLERVRETRWTKDGNSRRHKVRYFRFETRHKHSTGAKKENIKYQKVKKGFFAPLMVALQTKILGKYT